MEALSKYTGSPISNVKELMCIFKMADEEGGSKVPSNDEEDKDDSPRLWIGNIDKRLSEYNLLKIIQRFGQVKHFEYLFHTSGPHKGEPRGYCFVQYESKQEATKAIKVLNGKMALSRALVVRWANDDKKTGKLEEMMDMKQIEAKAGSSLSSRSVSHDTKIQAIEAKLKLMDSASYSDNTSTRANKHPLLLESERNRNKPYQCSKSKSKTEKWKIVNKPR